MRDNKQYTLLDAAGAANAYKMVSVEDFRNAVFSFSTDGGGDAALTVKFVGSIADTAPVPSSAQSVTNHYDFIEVIDLEDGAAIDGDTGVAVAGADDYRLLEANVNGLKWIGVFVSARAQGEVTVKCRLFSDQ